MDVPRSVYCARLRVLVRTINAGNTSDLFLHVSIHCRFVGTASSAIRMGHLLPFLAFVCVVTLETLLIRI